VRLIDEAAINDPWYRNDSSAAKIQDASEFTIKHVVAVLKGYLTTANPRTT